MNLLSNYYQPADTTTSLTTGQLEFTLETGKKIFQQGEDIDIKLSVKNITDKPVKLEFETTQSCVFIIRRQVNFVFFSYGMDVWKSSYGKRYEEKENQIVLKQGQKKTFQTAWKQVNAKGESVDPGKYVISAALLTKNKQPLLQLRMNTK